MPFRQLPAIDPEVSIGMWHVEEDEDYFLSRLAIYENEKRILESISHPQKRLEWMSSRLCLKELLKISHRVESLNEVSGKPYLSDYSFHISYSHSNMYSGAIASPVYPVSMDLEDLSKKRNPETRFLFMHPDELEYYDSVGDSRLFFLIWSSKETLYKMYAKKGIAFKNNLMINPERKPLEQSGTVLGILKANGTEKTYTIHYHFFDGVLLTFTYDPRVPTA
jgi:4'-phosphopantetheinyl transferase EntD